MERLAVRYADPNGCVVASRSWSERLGPQRDGSWPVYRSSWLIGSNASFGPTLFAWPEGCAGCPRRSCRPIRKPVLTSPSKAAAIPAADRWRGSPAFPRSPSSDPRLHPSRKLACGGPAAEATQARELACKATAPSFATQRRHPFPASARFTTNRFTHGGRQPRFTGQGVAPGGPAPSAAPAPLTRSPAQPRDRETAGQAADHDQNWRDRASTGFSESASPPGTSGQEVPHRRSPGPKRSQQGLQAAAKLQSCRGLWGLVHPDSHRHRHGPGPLPLAAGTRPPAGRGRDCTTRPRQARARGLVGQSRAVATKLCRRRASLAAPGEQLARRHCQQHGSGSEAMGRGDRPRAAAA